MTKYIWVTLGQKIKIDWSDSSKGFIVKYYVLSCVVKNLLPDNVVSEIRLEFTFPNKCYQKLFAFQLVVT